MHGNNNCVPHVNTIVYNATYSTQSVARAPQSTYRTTLYQTVIIISITTRLLVFWLMLLFHWTPSPGHLPSPWIPGTLTLHTLWVHVLTPPRSSLVIIQGVPDSPPPQYAFVHLYKSLVINFYNYVMVPPSPSNDLLPPPPYTSNGGT